MALIRAKDFTCYAKIKSLSTGAKDAVIQRNLFTFKTALRIIGNT